MKILICGVGAIGSNLVKFLVPDLKGAHEITVLDMDNVEERNIIAGTQFYTEDQIGLPKVEALQYNIYQWYSREIDIVNENVKTYIQAGQMHDLVIDCFDNHEARQHIQETWNLFPKIMRAGMPFDLLHIGFSDTFTFAIEWADNYTVPTDITSGMDICELEGASSFVNKVASLGALTVQEFIKNGTKMEMLGGRFSHTLVK